MWTFSLLYRLRSSHEKVSYVQSLYKRDSENVFSISVGSDKALFNPYICAKSYIIQSYVFIIQDISFPYTIDGGNGAPYFIFICVSSSSLTITLTRISTIFIETECSPLQITVKKYLRFMDVHVKSKTKICHSLHKLKRMSINITGMYVRNIFECCCIKRMNVCFFFINILNGINIFRLIVNDTCFK